MTIPSGVCRVTVCAVAEFVTSFTPSTRVADVYSLDTDQFEVDSALTTFEINVATESNQPGFLFDMGTISAEYDGTDLIFDVDGTSILFTVSLKAFKQFAFMWDTEADLLSISIDDVPVVTGGSGFTVPTPGKLFIGSDDTGSNQINGQLNSFRILR